MATNIAVSLLGISESSSLSLQLKDYKTLEALHAAILTKFNILVDKGKVGHAPFFLRT